MFAFADHQPVVAGGQLRVDLAGVVGGQEQGGSQRRVAGPATSRCWCGSGAPAGAHPRRLGAKRAHRSPNPPRIAAASTTRVPGPDATIPLSWRPRRAFDALLHASISRRPGPRSGLPGGSFASREDRARRGFLHNRSVSAGAGDSASALSSRQCPRLGRDQQRGQSAPAVSAQRGRVGQPAVQDIQRGLAVVGAADAFPQSGPSNSSSASMPDRSPPAVYTSCARRRTAAPQRVRRPGVGERVQPARRRAAATAWPAPAKSSLSLSGGSL